MPSHREGESQKEQAPKEHGGRGWQAVAGFAFPLLATRGTRNMAKSKARPSPVRQGVAALSWVRKVTASTCCTQLSSLRALLCRRYHGNRWTLTKSQESAKSKNKYRLLQCRFGTSSLFCDIIHLVATRFRLARGQSCLYEEKRSSISDSFENVENATNKPEPCVSILNGLGNHCRWKLQCSHPNYKIHSESNGLLPGHRPKNKIHKFILAKKISPCNPNNMP